MVEEKKSTVQDMQVDKTNAEWDRDQMTIRRQRILQRRCIFYTCLAACLTMLAYFVYLVAHSERIMALIEATPYAIVLITLTGIIPMFLLAILFKGVFQVATKEIDIAPKESLGSLREAVGIARDAS